MPKLSVIVPIYNGEKYLRRCLNSILAQSFLDFELILIDDGSKDSSGKICDEYAAADSRVTVIHTENRGVARARKTGLEQASGEYVSCVDCDDWIDKDLYSHMVDCAAQHDADIVVCAISLEQKKQGQICEIPRGVYGKTELVRDIYPRMIYDAQTNASVVTPSLCDKLFRREMFRDIYNTVDVELTLGEDAMCTYPCLMAAECVCFVGETTCYHYWQEHSENLYQMGEELLTRLRVMAEQMAELFWNEPVTELQSKCYIAQYATYCIRQIVVHNKVMRWKEKKKAVLAFLEDATIQTAFSAAERNIVERKLKVKIRLLSRKRFLAFWCLAAGKDLMLRAREEKLCL